MRTQVKQQTARYESNSALACMFHGVVTAAKRMTPQCGPLRARGAFLRSQAAARSLMLPAGCRTYDTMNAWRRFPDNYHFSRRSILRLTSVGWISRPAITPR
jgi:hypothetical protein